MMMTTWDGNMTTWDGNFPACLHNLCRQIAERRVLLKSCESANRQFDDHVGDDGHVQTTFSLKLMRGEFF